MATKIEACQQTISYRDPNTGRTELQRCLGEKGHEKPHPDDGKKGFRIQGSQPHQFRPRCEGCGQEVPTLWNDERNIRWLP